MPTLSEQESRQWLAPFGVPMVEAEVAHDADGAVAAAERLGYPVAVKASAPALAHKTEKGLVRLGLADGAAVHLAADELLASARQADPGALVLVSPMVQGARELIAGVATDPQLGPVVMVGVGGVLAEAVADVVFRLVPVTRADAAEMLDDLTSQALLGPVRGEPPVERAAVVELLLALSRAAETSDGRLVAADLNPVVIVDGQPIAVDALVELADAHQPTEAFDTVDRPVGTDSRSIRSRRIGRSEVDSSRFLSLFEPAGVVVVGASSHPGKFGFVALHNLLASGFGGRVFATNRDGTDVLGVQTFADLAQLPDGAADLAVVCTPAAANLDVLKAAGSKGVRAAYVTSAGYAEAGEAGVRAQHELVELAESLGVLLVGPNGQGVVSTPARLCAQIVAPYPPRGRIGIVSQSGNLVSSLMNYAGHYGIGVSRAVSIGNAAAVGLVDVLEFYADDPETAVAIAYAEGVEGGRRFFERLRAVSERLPVVLVKGGVSAAGARAANSHTGALATDDRIFDGAARQAGVLRARTIDEAYEVAATFATQPLPTGPEVAVVTTAGGWGVVASDAIERAPGLHLLPLPEALRAALDRELPPRWSRGNPVDLAGGETKDTVPTVLEVVAAHPAVDAVVFLGTGIQGNQARMEREGGFHPGHGLDRIVAFHERQERRYQEAAAAVSTSTGKPVLTATELAVTDRDNPAVAAVRASGRLCYPSAERAVNALAHLYRYATIRARQDGP